MSDEQSNRISIPTGDSSGIILEQTDVEGQPVVRVSLAIDGVAHRVTLQPLDALGLSFAIAGLVDQARQKIEKQTTQPRLGVAEMMN